MRRGQEFRTDRGILMSITGKAECQEVTPADHRSRSVFSPIPRMWQKVFVSMMPYSTFLSACARMLLTGMRAKRTERFYGRYLSPLLTGLSTSLVVHPNRRPSGLYRIASFLQPAAVFLGEISCLLASSVKDFKDSAWVGPEQT